MRRHLKEAAHLIPLVFVLCAGLLVFLLLRQVLVPKTFGRYGHYRATALDDIRARPISFAGQTACAMCHDEVVAVRAKGSHHGVSCEACHGPLAKHADDPSTLKPKQLAGTGLCQTCHRADPAKPKQFPQVSPEEHSGGAECISCHQPHSPRIE